MHPSLGRAELKILTAVRFVISVIMDERRRRNVMGGINVVDRKGGVWFVGCVGELFGADGGIATQLLTVANIMTA